MQPASIKGVIELAGKPFKDSRGAFLNAFRAQEEGFMTSWGERAIKQVNMSRTDIVGTIRGLHLQKEPYTEARLVRCIKGKVWDVAVDLRCDSDSYCQWQAVELSQERSNSLLIPEGFAHGFQVLEPFSELLYLHSGAWVPEAETGVRWDDQNVMITWPIPVTVLSKRDRELPFLTNT